MVSGWQIKLKIIFLYLCLYCCLPVCRRSLDADRNDGVFWTDDSEDFWTASARLDADWDAETMQFLEKNIVAAKMASFEGEADVEEVLRRNAPAPIVSAEEESRESFMAALLVWYYRWGISMLFEVL